MATQEQMIKKAQGLLRNLMMDVGFCESDPLWHSGDDYVPSGVTTDPTEAQKERFPKNLAEVRRLLEQIDGDFNELFPITTHPDELERRWHQLAS